MAALLIFLVALLAFANGSNDNGKGVATMVGNGVAKPLAALIWATGTTLIGAAVSFWLAGGLLKGFSTGLFAQGTPVTGALFVSVLIGACGWILFATRTGLPVSTTHAIVGALTGAGLVAFGMAKVEWSFLGAKLAVPLALSPILSLATVYAAAWPVVFILTRVAGKCICVVERESAAVTTGGALALTAMPSTRVLVSSETICESPIAVITPSATAHVVHWLSSGLISFARGWNDTPKIAALSLLALAQVKHGMAVGFIVVAMAMAAGGMLAGRRVLTTLSKKLTPLPMAESLTASLATAALVCLASWFALPVSTTHVATGAIIGAGLKNNPRNVRWGKVGEIVLSWIITLPVAASLAAGAKWMLK